MIRERNFVRKKKKMRSDLTKREKQNLSDQSQYKRSNVKVI